MSKTFITVHGTMGVGKSAVCQHLYKRLEHSIWLDGDWCWMMNPWIFSEENKRMVESNITHLLRNFLKNSSCQYVLFSWVLHQEEIFKMLLTSLQDLHFNLYRIALLCSEETLRMRMMHDDRDRETIERSIQRLPYYQAMESIKLDTTDMMVSEVANNILHLINYSACPSESEKELIL